MGKDPHWIEHAKAQGKIRSGAYGHHSAAQTDKDAKRGGILGKRARLAKTLRSLHERGSETLYGKK
jgi:hypothetical protein